MRPTADWTISYDDDGGESLSRVPPPHGDRQLIHESVGPALDRRADTFVWTAEEMPLPFPSNVAPEQGQLYLSAED